jgi:Surface-adhesin protein E
MKTILLIVGIFYASGLIAQTDSTATTSDTTSAVPSQISLPVPEWIYVADDVNHESWYIKSGYISKSPRGEIKMWIKIKEPLLSFNRKIYKDVEEKMLYIFDCVNKKIQLLSVIAYSHSGDVIDSEDTDSPISQNVVPQSIMDLVLQKICSTFNND